ncbi:MOSC domain-containing protein [Halopenitus persicus]|uniref:MOSC domain-containing protein n=1 Tax=Halopenitus persicus TaxID=1048396 RepID=UPI000BBAC90E|nr:MOSC N-terminal beta barrel domain-containing protein [Halopenitus persicus]
MARLERIRVFPVKGLDGIDVETSTIREGGTLAYDREFGLVGDDGEVVNGKDFERIHELRTDFDTETGELSVGTPNGDSRRFALDEDDERSRAGDWFSDVFDADLTLERNSSVGFVDRPDMGPSVISTGTLEAVASWFDDLTVDGARRRLRANVEISEVEPFWEDRFVGDDAPAFTVGGVRFEGVTPCARCVVPSRDPDTGEPLPEFRTRFIEKRRETFPDWADPDAFDHHYTLMIIAGIPETDRGGSIRIGDEVRVVNR